jgi:hypothetical protein
MGGMISDKAKSKCQRKTCLTISLSTKNATWTTQNVKPGGIPEKLAKNRLIYGMIDNCS